MQFVPYARKDFKKSMIDHQLAWLWENGIRPQIAAMMENKATGDKVVAGDWKEDRIILSVGISDIKHYTSDNDAIYFECSMRGRSTAIVIPYTCIASVQSEQSNWVKTKSDKIDPFWMAFPMALAHDLSEIEGTNAIMGCEPKVIYNGSPAEPVKAKVEVRVADVVKTEGNVTHVNFGVKK